MTQDSASSAYYDLSDCGRSEQALRVLERTPADFHAVSAVSLVAEYGKTCGLQLSTQALQVCPSGFYVLPRKPLITGYL